MRALSNLPADELVVQHGASEPPAAARESAAFLPLPRRLEPMREAGVVVTPARVATSLSATRAGLAPLVVPRQHVLGEHGDDHQMDLTRESAAHGGVVPVCDTADLAALAAAAQLRP